MEAFNDKQGVFMSVRLAVSVLSLSIFIAALSAVAEKTRDAQAPLGSRVSLSSRAPSIRVLGKRPVQPETVQSKTVGTTTVPSVTSVTLPEKWQNAVHRFLW
jgi:hypothetical protein